MLPTSTVSEFTSPGARMRYEPMRQASFEMCRTSVLAGAGAVSTPVHVGVGVAVGGHPGQGVGVSVGVGVIVAVGVIVGAGVIVAVSVMPLGWKSWKGYRARRRSGSPAITPSVTP